MDDLKPLLAFAAVMEYGSMHAAGKALGISASAISQHITRLESLHGVKLLKRSTRRLFPTEAGKILATHCQTLRQAIHNTQQALDNVKTEIAGEVSLALPTGLIFSAPLQQALLNIAKRLSLIKIRLVVADQLVDLQQQSIDIALRGGEHALDAPDLIARHLVDWQWHMVASPSYLAQHNLPKNPADLAHLRWLTCMPMTYELRYQQERILWKMPNTWNMGDLATVRQMTLAGLGASVQLAGDIATAVQQEHLTILLPQWQMPTIALYAITPHRVQSAKVAAVLAILLESFHTDTKLL